VPPVPPDETTIGFGGVSAQTWFAAKPRPSAGTAVSNIRRCITLSYSVFQWKLMPFKFGSTRGGVGGFVALLFIQ
jgi:hypothetical protein